MVSTAPSPLKYTSKLQGRRVLVLGGSSGVGFCVAEAALEHGAHVTISSSSQPKIDRAVARLRAHARAAGLPDDAAAARVAAKTCDLARPEAIEGNLLALLEFATGGDDKDSNGNGNGKRLLDHVVFTAGDALRLVPVSDISVDDVQRAGVVRQLGPIMLAKHLPRYVARDVRSSLTLTGGSYASRPARGWGVLAGLAASIEGLARGLAVDLRPVRVNCVQLGAVETELFASVPEDRLPAMLEAFRAESVTGTVARPEEVAEAYIYCMKHTFATGAVVDASGGRLVGDSRGV